MTFSRLHTEYSGILADCVLDRVPAVFNASLFQEKSAERVILEDKNSLSHRSAVTGKFSYEVNEKKYFLNNTLSPESRK